MRPRTIVLAYYDWSVMLNAIDLFSGAGGLSHGMQTAGVNVAMAIEIEHDFACSHKLNHPSCHMINADIHNISISSELKALNLSGKIDIVSGGPPCQGFSTVGKKDSSDPRNSLFEEFLRAVDEAKPKYVLFENVSGFKKMYNQIAYNTLLTELSKRGFSCSSSVLNACHYGLPQSRQRTIVVGWLNELVSVELPRPTHDENTDLFHPSLKPLTLIDAISDLPPLAARQSSNNYLCDPMNDYQKMMRGNQQILTEHNCANYGPKMQKILKLIPPGGSVEDLPLELRPKSYFKNTYARLLPDQPSPTITRNFGTPSSSRCVHPFQNRALSTREGARLQGFPDSYKFVGSKISKNLQIGNAVPPIFGFLLAKSIIHSELASGINEQTLVSAI